MKATRNTFKKRISAAATKKQKWKLALMGGRGPTEIEQMVYEVATLRTPSLHGPAWRSQAIERLKARFAEALFPALLNNRPDTFKNLIAAMRGLGTRSNLVEYVRRRNGLTPRQQASNRLDCALLNLPKGVKGLGAVCRFLDDAGVNYADDAAVWNRMKFLGVVK